MLKRAGFGVAAPLAALPLSERRVSGRIRVFDPGKLLFGSSAGNVDCMITDISETGAGILSSFEPARLPKETILVYLRRRIAYEALVMWNEGDRIGLRFLREHDLVRPATPGLEAISRLCTGH